MPETAPPMSRARRIRRVVLGLMSLLGALAMGLLIRSNRPGPKAAFDGGQMELLGVSYGSVHFCPKAYPWERLSWLPAGVVSRLPASGYPTATPALRPSLRVWVALSHAPPTSTVWYLVAEGTNAVAVPATVMPSKSVRGQEVLQADFPAWPRFAGSYRLEARRRLDSVWAPEPLGSLLVKVPSVRIGAPLVPVAVPSTNGVPGEPWRIVIDRFEHGWSLRQAGLPALETNLVPAASALRARLVSDDPADRGWFLISVRSATNVSGDVLTPSMSNWLSTRPGLILSPGPWPGEAWDVSLEFSRNGGFRLDELVPLPALPLLEPGSRPLVWQTNVHGIQLALRSVKLGSDGPGDSELRVSASHVPIGWNVSLAGLKDETGADCWISPRGGGLNAREMRFRWRARPGQSVAYPTLAVHRSRMATLTLQPTRAQ